VTSDHEPGNVSRNRLQRLDEKDRRDEIFLSGLKLRPPVRRTFFLQAVKPCPEKKSKTQAEQFAEKVGRRVFRG
jgi:hypothetical protein